MATIRPKTGTDEDRLFALAIGPGDMIKPDELHATRDQKRLFLADGSGATDEIIGPKYLGEVASEAAMLALNSTHAHGCHEGDWCVRTDASKVAKCISNRGEALSDWIFMPFEAVATPAGHWEPLTNGNPSSPEVLFSANGDILMTFVED